MRPTSVLAAAMILVFAAPGLAQTPPPGTPTRIRGTIESLDGQTLVVKSREGPSLTIALAANFDVLGVARRSLADIKIGDFLAATSLKGTDGKQHAVEVHIFLPAQRGVVAERQGPSDLVPDGLMTNAIVGAIEKAPEGDVLHLTYKGGEIDIIVGPDVPIVVYVPGDAGLLKPGAAISMIAFKKPDGSLTAARATAEKDGVKPPM